MTFETAGSSFGSARHLCARALVGVFPGLQRPGSQRRQLGLKDGDAAPRGGHELEGSLQRRAEGAVGLRALAEHGWQGGEQVLHQLQEGGETGGGSVKKKPSSGHQSKQEEMTSQRNRGGTSLLSFKFTIRLS